MFRSRWRRWVRERTPGFLYYRLGLVVPKVRDCGDHEWHYAGDGRDACYHCEITRLAPTSPETWSVAGDSEGAFVESYVGLMGQIAALKRGALGNEPAAYVAEFEEIIEALEALDAPTSDWADLRADATRELRRRLVMMRLGARPSPESLDAANAIWSEIELRLDDLLKDKNAI